jgi:hypothetical protein
MGLRVGNMGVCTIISPSVWQLKRNSIPFLVLLEAVLALNELV